MVIWSLEERKAEKWQSITFSLEPTKKWDTTVVFQKMYIV
jgi:hypothetical protein